MGGSPINMETLRKGLFRLWTGSLAGYQKSKLPADFSTHPSIVVLEGLKFKVISSAEAKQLKKTHRVYVWCDVCNKWLPAGRYIQHCRQSRVHTQALAPKW